MGDVIELRAWRGASAGPRVEDGPRSMDRLDRAVERLDRLARGAARRGRRLQPDVETELLAIIGEITLGLVDQASVRAEELAERLAEPAGNE